jgi:hypothetical protein
MNLEEYITAVNLRFRTIRSVKPGEVVKIKTYLGDDMVDYRVFYNDKIKERIDLTYGTNTTPKVSILWQNIEQISVCT